MNTSVTQAKLADVEVIGGLFDQYRVFYNKESNLSGGIDFITTRIEQKDNILNMRRDQVSSLGFKVKKDFYIDHLEYRASATYLKGVIHNDIENNGEFQTSQLAAQLSVNLTNDYHIGINAKATQYSDIGINRESSMGLNLIYDLK